MKHLPLTFIKHLKSQLLPVPARRTGPGPEPTEREQHEQGYSWVNAMLFSF